MDSITLEGKPTVLHNASALEPGMLPVIRVVVTLALVLQLMPLFAIVRVAYAPAPLLIQLVVLAILMGFAFWPHLPQRLGRWFLPLFVVTFALGVIAAHTNLMVWMLQQPALRTYYVTNSSPMAPGDASWSLFVFLMIPVVLMAWQYDFQQVVGFVAAVALLEAVTIGAVMLYFGLPPFPPAAVGVAHAFVLLLIGYIVTRMMKAQRAQRRELAAYAATLEQLTVSRERNRMARELHDTLAHSLSAVSVQLEAADSAFTTAPETAHVLLAKALAQTRAGLTETRRALQALRASPLEDLGLGLAIKTLAETTAKRAGIGIDVHIDEPLPTLAPSIEQGIYRIAQEALANAVRHAHATRLQVAFTSNKQWELLIADDGIGFDPDQDCEEGHWGVQGMRERAAMMGAALHIQSAAQQGTTIRLVLP